MGLFCFLTFCLCTCWLFLWCYPHDCWLEPCSHTLLYFFHAVHQDLLYSGLYSLHWLSSWALKPIAIQNYAIQLFYFICATNNCFLLTAMQSEHCVAICNAPPWVHSLSRVLQRNSQPSLVDLLHNQPRQGGQRCASHSHSTVTTQPSNCIQTVSFSSYIHPAKLFTIRNILHKTRSLLWDLFLQCCLREMSPLRLPVILPWHQLKVLSVSSYFCQIIQNRQMHVKDTLEKSSRNFTLLWGWEPSEKSWDFVRQLLLISSHVLLA